MIDNGPAIIRAGNSSIDFLVFPADIVNEKFAADFSKRERERISQPQLETRVSVCQMESMPLFSHCSTHRQNP